MPWLDAYETEPLSRIETELPDLVLIRKPLKEERIFR